MDMILILKESNIEIKTAAGREVLLATIIFVSRIL